MNDTIESKVAACVATWEAWRDQLKGAIVAFKAALPQAQWVPNVEIDEYQATKKTVEAAVHHLVDLAKAAFLPPGARLEVNTHDLYQKIPHDLERFEPRKIWDWLERTYGGGQAERIAGAHVARELRSRLLRWKHATRRHEKPASRGAGYVCEYHMTPDSFVPPGGGDVLRYSYSSAMDVARFIHEAIEPFAANMVANGDEAWCIQAAANRYVARINRAGGESITPREKVVIGPITLIHYKSKIEWVFTAKAMEQLMLFIATYAPPEAEAA